ncbi:MAG: signal recognition particle-docking protein FtsY [Proteobacteria bacterium]|nr:signal recognition particle-docking protein FtsY [Pseudomonadota bacterium]
MLSFLKKSPETSLFSRLKNGLAKTRSQLGEGISSLFLGKKTISKDILEGIEAQLLTADVGIQATQHIIQELTTQLSRQELAEPEVLFRALRASLLEILQPCQQPLTISGDVRPFVLLVVGVNGSGKTTTIGKLAKRFQQEGKKVLLAAGDTFRSAAIEQLQVWGERNQIPVISQQSGADSASVIYDAIAAAKARDYDVVIADTAGRLHTQFNLMEELKKVKRVIQKCDPSAPHEVMLVLDAGIGQNALTQAKEFSQAVQVTGITITKLDGTAKGGILFSIAKQLNIPIRFIGVGESIDDLRPFDAEEFVTALFDNVSE